MIDQIGPKKYLDIPGTDIIELPPLIVKNTGLIRRLDKIVDLASKVVEIEGWVQTTALDELNTDLNVERRKMDLALNIADAYVGVVRDWHWGDGVLEWIRQCEITFKSRVLLRGLLRTDVWPHAGLSSFVDLLVDKNVPTENIPLNKAVGLRLTFRQPPPLGCCNDYFLFYANSHIAESVYQDWSQMGQPTSFLPPERFEVKLVDM